MNEPATCRIFLRAVISRIRLTSVLRVTPSSDLGAVYLGPRLCWAADLAEHEQVEVINLTRGVRLGGYVRFGREGELHVEQASGLLMQPDDLLKLTAYAWVPEPAMAEHKATFVNVDDDNFATEFRRVVPRVTRLDPASFPLPPVNETRVLTPREPVEATD